MLNSYLLLLADWGEGIPFELLQATKDWVDYDEDRNRFDLLTVCLEQLESWHETSATDVNKLTKVTGLLSNLIARRAKEATKT